MIKFTDPELVDSKNDSTCRICSKVFSNKYVKEQHHKDVHLKIKNFKCQHCDYRCVKQSNLRQHHKDVHLKLKDFKCSHCNYRCSQKSNLKKHLKTHFKQHLQ